MKQRIDEKVSFSEDPLRQNASEPKQKINNFDAYLSEKLGVDIRNEHNNIPVDHTLRRGAVHLHLLGVKNCMKVIGPT